MVKQTWITLGGIFAFLAVAFGAFGAHGLETRLTSQMLEVYKTGAYYQMVHALGLIFIGQRVELHPRSRLLQISGALLALGILLFSGSLYILAISGERRWGMVTPLGGLCFLVGWALFVAAEIAVRRSRDK